MIAEDGACGLCYEHSPSEGIAVVQLIEHLLAYMYVTSMYSCATVLEYSFKNYSTGTTLDNVST